MKIGFGGQVLGLYFAGFYILPFFLVLLVGFHDNFVELTLSPYIFFVILLFGIAWLLSYCFFKFAIPPIRLKYLDIFKPKIIWFTLSLVVVSIGIYFYANYSLGYRQTGPRLSESGVIMMLMFLVKPIIFAYFFHLFFIGIEDERHFGLQYSTVLLFSLFWLLTIVAAFEVLLLGLIVIYLINYKLFKIVFYFETNTTGLSRLLVLSFMLVLGLVFLFGIVFIGIANKIGIGSAWSYFFDSGGFSKTVWYLYYRISVFFSSFVLYIENHAFDWSLYQKSINVLIDAFYYRASIILDFEAERPHLTNLNRLNYELLYSRVQDKEIGASPGYLGAFSMVFPSSLAVILAGFYTSVLHLLLNRVGTNLKHISPLAILLAVYFSFPFLHNPLNSLFLIGPESFKFILYLYTIILIGQKNIHIQRASYQLGTTRVRFS